MTFFLISLGLTAALLLSITLTPVVKYIAPLVGAVDAPNDRKVHDISMPRLGGAAIYLAFALAYVSIIAYTSTVATNVGYALLLGGGFVVLIGVLDDIYDLSPRWKLLGQAIACFIAIYFGLNLEVITLPFLSSPLELGWLSIPLTLLWIVGVTNAINLIDGLDGLASGVSAIAAIALGVVSLLIGNFLTAFLCFLIVGALLGFLLYNFHPASIFMGDSGSLFLGYSLAVLSLMELKQATLVAFLIPLLIMAVPIADTAYALLRRRLKKQSFVQADKSHLHHCLLAIGFSHRKTVLTIYFISMCFAIMGILVTQTSLWITFVFFVVYLIFFEVFAEYIGMVDSRYRPLLSFYEKFLHGLSWLKRRCFKKR